MAKTSKYRATGFVLLSQLDSGGLFTFRADTDNIAKGDALHDDGTGYATNAITAFAATFMGIANEDFDNSSGSKAAANTVQIIPPLRHYRWIVAVESNTTIAQTNVGTIVDLQSVNTIDISDTTGAANALGFFIDEIDVSSDATSANTYGFAIGHFVGHHA